MDPYFIDLPHELKKRNLRFSEERLKILKYLVGDRSHATADQIYRALHTDLPTLSKTTVYNTLKALLRAGMIREIEIDDHETRYDIIIENHGHFKCESCGTIYDFSINIDSLTSGDLNNFKINDRNVYFKGICPGCLSNINEHK